MLYSVVENDVFLKNILKIVFKNMVRFKSVYSL